MRYLQHVDAGGADGIFSLFRNIALLTVLFLVTCLVLPSQSLVTLTSAQSWTEAEYPVGDGPKSVALSDLDGDGQDDMVTANKYSNDVSILFNNGDDTFTSAIDIDVDDTPNALQLADIDGDDNIDIVISHRFISVSGPPRNNNVSVLYNDGSGDFSDQLRFEIGEYGFSLFLADVREDEDGDIDIITIDDDNNEVTVLYNDGSGRDFPTSAVYEVGETPKSVLLADLDGDEHDDIVTANWLDDRVSVLINRGDGTFKGKVDYVTGDQPRSLYVVDIDNDTDVDIFTADQFGPTVSLLRNKGDGTFTNPRSYKVGDGPLSVFVRDVDGDGDDDILTANMAGESISYLLNYGDGTFAPMLSRSLSGSPNSILLADLGGVDSPVIVVSDMERDSVHLLSKNLPPSIVLIEPDAAYNTADKLFRITWYDKDLDDNASIDLYYCYATEPETCFPVVSGLSEDDEIDAYTWDTSEVPAGHYCIMAVISDGYSTGTGLSEGNITVDHPVPEPVIDSGIRDMLIVTLILIVFIGVLTGIVLGLRKIQERKESDEEDYEQQ